MPVREHARFWYLLGVMLVLAVVYTSLAPSKLLPHVSLSDKLEHALAYTVIAVWFGGLLKRSDYWRLAAVLLALGAAIEIAQGLMPFGRTADFADLSANALGILLGIAACWCGLGQWVSWIEHRVRRR
jgi:VanZ family protein